jgi:hypothetical protein
VALFPPLPVIEGMSKDEYSQQSPGRLRLSTEKTNEIDRLPGFRYSNDTPTTAVVDGIRGNWEPNLLNQTFFSPANFQILQNKIRYSVYSKTGKVIDPVSSDDLFMVMRAIYLQYGRNLPTNIREQIEELNEHVAVACIPTIVSEISMFATYIRDISSMPLPMEHPVSLSSAGTKSLPFKPFFGETSRH